MADTYGFQDGSSYTAAAGTTGGAGNQVQVAPPTTPVITPASTVNPVGSGVGAPVATPTPISNTMTPSSLTTTQPSVSVPVQQPPTPIDPNSTPNTAAAALDKFQAQQDAASQDGTNTKQYNSISQNLINLLGQDTGKTAAYAAAEDAAGVNTLTSNLNDVNNQITTMQAQANSEGVASIANQRAVENLDTLLPYAQEGQAKIAGDNAIKQALYQSQVGVLNARAQTLIGNITLAKNMADKSVDVKYAPIEEGIDIYNKQLAILAPLMSAEEQKQAAAKTLSNQVQLQKISDQKDQEKSNLAIALQSGANTKFINNDGQFFDTATGESFPDAQSFFKAAGVSSFDEAYQKGLITDWTPAKAADSNAVQQIIAKYPDAGVKPTDTLEQATAKLHSNSSLYRKDTYIAPVSGSGNGGSTPPSYVPGANPAVDSYVQLINTGKLPPAQWSQIPNDLINAVMQGVSATSGGSDAQSQILNTTQTSLKELQDMVNSNNGFTSAVGAKGISSFFGIKGSPVAGSSAADFDAKLKQTVNDVVLPNLTLLHGLGRVTDREFQALQSSLTSLSPNLSENQFKSELADITNQINNAASAANTSTPSAPASSTVGDITNSQPAQMILNGKTLNLQPDGTYQ